MNRKQKIAVVVGVVVIVLLVLFPPYVRRVEGYVVSEWVGAEPPAFAFRWIGSGPPAGLMYVGEQELVACCPETLGGWFSPPATEQVEPKPTIPIQYEERTKYVCCAVPYRISALTLTIVISTALALTVAAVRGLRERKGTCVDEHPAR